MDAKRDLKLFRAPFRSKQVPYREERASAYKRNVSGRFTLLPGTELRPVSFNKRQQNEEAFFQKHSWRAHVSPMFPSFPNAGNIVSSVSFCFQDANYAYTRTLHGREF